MDTDHRKLTIEELQRALFDEDLNPFVTWLTANASTVFSAFDVDGDRTLDYDELVYCISMYEEAEKQRKQAIEDAKSFEEKEREREDAETLLMAKEDIKPEIDAALDDLGFDLLEQNIPGFDQEAADEMRREAEEEALIKWEVGTTKPCSFRDLIHTVDVDTRTAPPSTPSTRPFTTRRQDARPGRAGVVRLPLLITAADGAGLVAGSL